MYLCVYVCMYAVFPQRVVPSFNFKVYAENTDWKHFSLGNFRVGLLHVASDQNWFFQNTTGRFSVSTAIQYYSYKQF